MSTSISRKIVRLVQPLDKKKMYGANGVMQTSM